MDGFEEYLDKMGYSWNDFDRPYEMQNLIEQFANEKVSKELKELKESNNNGMDWFNAYGEVDGFIFDELVKIGKEFPLDNDKPELNTIEAIKILINRYKE